MRRAALLRTPVSGILISTVCLVIGLASTRPLSSQEARSDDCQASTAGEAYRNLPAPYAPGPGTAIVHVRVGGQDFYVPQNYFRHPAIGCGAEEQGFLLRVLLPDMEGYTTANADEIEGVDKPGWRRRMNILVQAFNRLRDFTRLLADGAAPTANYPTQYGLLYARSNRIDGGGPRTETDVFFQYDDGTVKRFILCDAETAVPFPGCAHQFLYRGLRVQATYGRTYLSQWRDVEDKVRSLLDRFGFRSTQEQ